MALFESTDKSFETLIDANKKKRISTILGTDPFLRKLKALSPTDLANFRYGSFFLAGIFGLAGYYFYRKYYEQTMTISQNKYKLLSTTPLNAGDQFWHPTIQDAAVYTQSLFYRMPEKEFDILYRMRSAYIKGQFDHNKEILIPRNKDGFSGYDVITPFYYYQKAMLNLQMAGFNGDGTQYRKDDIHRGGIAVHRGW
jgi:hypothetical protein